MSNKTSNFVKIIKEICQEEEISMESFSCDFMFRLTKCGKINYIFGYQFGLNLASTHLICEDKSTVSELLTYAGIPNVEHYCFLSPMNMKYVEANGNWSKLLSMLNTYKTLVLKDNKGTGGLSVYKVNNIVELENAVQILFQSAHSICASPYYNILREYRLILLDGEIKFIYHKEREHFLGDGKHTIRELYAAHILQHGTISEIPAEDAAMVLKKGEPYFLNWKHNLGQGAFPIFDTKETINNHLKELAKKVASTIPIRFASIDIIEVPNINVQQADCSKEYLVLEINSGVMMEYLSQANTIGWFTAKEIYREAILKMME